MLVAVLKNVDTGPDYPIEVRANVCSLIGQIGKNASGVPLVKIKEATEPILRDLAERFKDLTGRDAILGTAARKVSDGWA
jgi:hypothetical protein